VSLEEYSRGCAHSGRIVAAIVSGDVRSLGRALGGSFVERARARLIPGFASVCESARDAGAEGATISGAGPSIVAVVDASRIEPAKVAAAMCEAFGRAGLGADAHVARVAGAARVLEVR
jgi:homoserine kinase